MKKLLILSSLLCLFFLCLVYSVSVQKTLANNLTRLHIIANSNSSVDQSIKYAVRDEILEYVKHSKELPDTSELQAVSKAHLFKIGAPYTADVTLENCYVPKKDYKSLSLPEGRYNCIKVVLGSGLGENWWCIAYPPLCYTESMFGELSENGNDALSKLLDAETLAAITRSGKVNFRFKIVDEIQKLIHKKATGH